MKNLGQTIDRLIKLDQDFESVLVPLKDKWKKRPSKTELYWKELMNYLNSPSIMEHPKRDLIKDIVIPKTRKTPHSSSFNEMERNEKIIGVIPEHLSCTITRFDHKAIATARDNAEAMITKHPELIASVLRRQALNTIDSSKIWIALKDYFNLWEKPNNYGIRKNKGILVLVEIPQQEKPLGMAFPINPEMLKGLFGREE